MKYIIKKDLRALLPGFVSSFMAGAGLLIITLFASFTGNGNLAMTSFTLFFIALVMINVYLIFKNAILYRNNLGDDKYIEDMQKHNIGYMFHSSVKVISCFVQCFVIVTEYLLFFLIGLSAASGRIDLFGEELSKNDIGTVISRSFGGKSPAAMLLTYVGIIFILLVVVTAAFAAFGLCYTYFIRGKYAGIAGTMTFFSLFWIEWKLYDTIVPTGGNAEIPISILVCIVLAVINSVITIFIVSKKRFDKANYV